MVHHIKLSSLATSDIDIFNALSGITDVNIDCANMATVMLSRENFLANIHNASNPSSTVEQINLIREKNDINRLTGFWNTASVSSIIICSGEWYKATEPPIIRASQGRD